MKVFITSLLAIDTADGELKEWAGQKVLAKDWEDAQRFCIENAGYLTVVGEFIEEIDYEEI